MLPATTAPPRSQERCPDCLLIVRLCVCSAVPRLEVRTEVVIVRHRAERRRASNTGRLAAAALASARVIEYGDDERVPARLALPVSLASAGTWLVYPEGAPCANPTPPPIRLVFLDGSWSQARRMRRKLLALRGLPVWRLPIEEVSRQRLRHSPGAGRVSTIEAIAVALRLCEGEAPAHALEALFALLVGRARDSGSGR
jgi:DTW domain-containing protein YfiP